MVSFCIEFVCSLSACMGSLLVLRFSATAQKHDYWVNRSLKIIKIMQLLNDLESKMRNYLVLTVNAVSSSFSERKIVRKGQRIARHSGKHKCGEIPHKKGKEKLVKI